MPRDLRNRAILTSLAVAGLMLVGKFVALFMTSSVAILSDFLESIIHVAATAMAAFSLWYSRQPADRDHPYGHGKIAYFSAGLEGAFIFVAGVGIFIASVQSFRQGHKPEQLSIGIIIMTTLAFMNLLLGLFLVRVGRRYNSVVLIANGQHVLSDMLTNIGVVIGIVVVWWTDIFWLDGVVALFVGVQVLLMAMTLMRKAYNGLMEWADPKRTEEIRAVLAAAVAKGDIVQFHQLRHREVNDELWIEAHLLMNGDQSVAKAHRVATKLEDELRKLFPDRRVRITTHLEPASHDEDHPQGHPDHLDGKEEF